MCSISDILFSGTTIFLNLKLLSHLIFYWSEAIYQTRSKGPYIFTTQNVIDFENMRPCPYDKDPFFTVDTGQLMEIV